MIVCYSLSITDSLATTVIAVWTPTEIVLGADSLVTDGGIQNSWTQCKMNSSNNIFWGESQILRVPSFNFSVDSIATEVMSTNTNFRSKVEQFETSVIQKLTLIVNAPKRGDEEYFRKEMEGKTALEIVFVTSEESTNKLSLRYFIANSDASSGDVRLTTYRVDCPNFECGNSRYISLGFHEKADMEVLSNTRIFEKGIDVGVRQSIEQEIAANPTRVGAPISLLRIDKIGPSWLSTGVCAK
jgi:hypothetical protein